MADILTSDHFDLLSDEARERSDLQILVEQAEIKVIDRYREVRPDSGFDYDIDGDPLEHDVQLDGWREDDQDRPDTDAMDDDLVRRLRLEIAKLVNHWVDIPDDYVESVSEGDRSVSYREIDEVPDDFGSLLRRYDERDVWH